MTMNLSITRFEKCRILGARALQISLGAPVLVDNGLSETDPLNLAGLEFERQPDTNQRHEDPSRRRSGKGGWE